MKTLLSDDSSTPSRGVQPPGIPSAQSVGASGLGSELTSIHSPQPAAIPPHATSPSVQTETATHLPGVNAGPVLNTSPAESPALEHDRTVISQRPAAMPSDFVRSLSLVELAKSLEGRNLHHFSVDRMIGGGGMGAVFRGRDLRLDREVAIKVIPESRRDPETLRRFRMEAQSAARLDHPNIARVYDIGEDEAWNYIVFEFIDGINLRDLVQIQGPMTIDDAVFTTRQVAEALQHAHQRDVVHRDIKPSNVIITPEGIAKVVDMGLARNTATDRSSADQTASGVTLGTFDYISPEQARDPRDADVRSDLYSLGCTLFYMLTGQPPFPEGTALQKLLNHGSQPPPDPRQWREDISDQLAAVLSKLMAKRPTERYQKPIELINDLLLIAQIESLPRSRTAGTILIRPTIARRTLLETHSPWLVPLCALLGSAIWLGSADSWTMPLEIPQPSLQSTQSLRYRDAPPNLLPAPGAPAEQTPARVSVPTESPAEALPSGKESKRGSTSIGENKPSIEGVLSGDTPAAKPFVSSSEKSLSSNARDMSAAAATPSTDTGKDAPSSETEPATDPVRRATTVAADVIRVGGSPTQSLGNLARWAPNLPAAMMQAAMQPDVRVIELNESIELNTALSVPRSGLTIRSAPGVDAELTLTGGDSFGLGWEAWIDVERKFLRCQSLRIRCLNDLRQPQAIFAMRSGGRVELDNCQITMLSSADGQLGSCIVIKEPIRSKANLIGPGSPAMPATLMPTTSATTVMPTPMPGQPDSPTSESSSSPATSASASEDEPLAIVMRDSVIRGAFSLITMRGVSRAEITLDKICAMLEGRILTVRKAEDERVPPVIRMNLQNSTLATKLGFAAIMCGNTSRVPLTLMRTAKLCAFWSPVAVPHVAIDGLENEDWIGKVLLLRGEENAYDQNVEPLCQCRFSDGQNVDFSFEDMTGEWFRELGNEHELRWRETVPPEQPMHAQTPSQYGLRDSMFMPGYK